jgi:hypothetical protein
MKRFDSDCISIDGHLCRSFSSVLLDLESNGIQQDAAEQMVASMMQGERDIPELVRE